MLGCNTVRFPVAIGVALGGAIAVGILACASSSAPPSDTAAAPGEVVDVLVEPSESGATVTVVGPKEPVFTAFQQSDPDRVIVDLANVEVGDLDQPVSVPEGAVQEVRVEALPGGGEEAMARVEITLSGPADYQVRPGENGLVIELTTLDSTASLDSREESAEAESEQDPWVAPESEVAGTSEEMVADPSGESDPWKGEAAAVPAKPTSVLSAVVARAVGEGSIIHLQSNGIVESAVTFTLEDPARLVIDLPEIESEVSSKRIDVDSAQIAQIRVGTHADKVRVVVDGGKAPAPFEGRRVIPVPTGLVIALGSDLALDDAVAQATGMSPEPQDAQVVADAGAPTGDASAASSGAAGKGASGQVTIYGVEFDAQAERDRVVVIGEEAVDYLVYEPDPETVVLSIARAKIAPDAAVRIAPEAPGAVSLVTAFEQPDVKIPEVRVVVKRAANLKPEVSRQGALLILDFPRTGALAAVPPVYDSNAALPGSGALGTTPSDPSAPAALAPGDASPGVALPDAPAEAASAAAPAAIEILNEGGLMDGKEYVGRRISLDFKEVDIADVLRLIAEVSDLNVIAGDEVKGKVTIRLVDVPWDQAMDVILLTKGLGFARIGNVLRVAANDVLAQEEELRLQERRAKEKLEDLVVKLQPVNYADVKDVSGMVKELLTPRGSVNTDSRTNTLIIKDIASVIDEATALVKAVDTMTPQVMIEAKIVEAGLEFSRELGSLWTFGANPLTESTLGGRDYVFQQGDTDGIGEGLGNQVVFGNPITAGPTGVMALAASVIDQKFNFEVELQAAEVNGDGKVISSPRIVTLDNSTATIEQGVSIPFQTFENGDAQLEFVDAVLKLDVTPHITSDSSIIMDIKVSRNAPDDSVFTLTGSPAIAKNQVKTETLVKDGQTLVLGGIYVVDRSERESRVPYLSRLPFIGNLFKSNEYSDSRKELLVFVSPRVVQTPAGDAS